VDTELETICGPSNGHHKLTADAAQCAEPNLIGCTQITGNFDIDGVELVAPLPQAFEAVRSHRRRLRPDHRPAGRELIAMTRWPARPLQQPFLRLRLCGFAERISGAQAY
jgi:hypothetical protein